MDINDFVEDKAEEAVGNWKEFSSFYWNDHPEDAEEWCIVYTHNRDSGLLEQSNAAVIEKEMKPYIEDGSVIFERHNHWGCGWMEGYAIRVYQTPAHKEVTAAFHAFCELQLALEDYPVLDDSDYSRREYEATLENIENEGYRWLIESPPADWSSQVFDYLWENNQRALESEDDRGGCPSEEDIREALRELNLHAPEDEND